MTPEELSMAGVETGDTTCTTQEKQGMGRRTRPGVSIALFTVGIALALLLIYAGSWITVTMGVRPGTPEIDSDFDDPLITFNEIPLDSDGLPTTEIIALAAPSVVSLTTYARGSSGGALVNIHGQVIGINVAKLTDAEIDNIGFAIPVHFVQSALQNLLENGEVAPLPELGIEVTPLNETNATGNDFPVEGLYITAVQTGSEISRKGVAEGDILLEAEGTPLATKADLNEVLKGFSAGDTIELLIYFAESGDTETVRVRLYAPGDLVDSSSSLPGVVPGSAPTDRDKPGSQPE